MTGRPPAAPVADFDTWRLSARRWRPSAANPDERAALGKELRTVLTPPVLRHLPDALRVGHGPAAMAEWIDARVAESDLFVVRTRGEGRVAGLLILAAFGETDGPLAVHIGYLLAEADWGKGFATELLTGLTEAARDAGPLRLTGGVGKANAASARALEKAGFRRDAGLSNDDTQIFTRDLP